MYTQHISTLSFPTFASDPGVTIVKSAACRVTLVDPPSSTDTFPSRSSGHSCFPRILRASCMSLHMIVTLFAWCCRSGEYIETEPTSAKTHTPLHMVQPEHSQRTRRETHRAQISIFKQSNEECLGCLLKRKNRSALEPNANSEILSNFPHLCKWGRVGGGASGRVLCVCV